MTKQESINQSKPESTSNIKVKRTRSKTGCLTCRKRKKRCDEKSKPTCLNCQLLKLECKWPELQIKTSNTIETIQQTNIRQDKSKSIKLDKQKMKNYYLSRIAMQQDCVENIDNDFNQSMHSDGSLVDSFIHYNK
ncbi:unnamed protein product [Candida verbasci]|uniref:Zn(2)-C6 fungal-type domain-containing protein n=1 Tax=Candida verbasci TaxID=1227364 RepID=A0A9W4TU64_9ASCO|nr:unnamed protein product [Candida verbasci]